MQHIADIPVIKMISLTLTQDEAQAIVNLIDAAVRAQGLQAAVVALPLVTKLQEAAKAAQEPSND